MWRKENDTKTFENFGCLYRVVPMFILVIICKIVLVIGQPKQTGEEFVLEAKAGTDSLFFGLAVEFCMLSNKAWI